MDERPLLSKIYNEKNTWAKNDFNVQTLSDLHFNSETGIFDNSRSPAHRGTLYALIAVAVLLLIIGAINFINLETAQAVRRAKEVGLRKVMGSSRMRLIIQFVCERLVITFISILIYSSTGIDYRHTHGWLADTLFAKHGPWLQKGCDNLFFCSFVGKEG